MLMSLCAIAQDNPSYTFQKLTEPYQNLTNSISLNNGLQWDDPDILIPVNMDFVVFGHAFNTLYFNMMGAGLTNESEENDYENSPFHMILSPILADYVDPCLDYGDYGGNGAKGGGQKRFRDEGDPGSCSNLSYRVDGDPGSRIFKFEWQNASLYDAMDSCFLNMQIWYYEDGHILEFRYGSSLISNDDLAEIQESEWLTPIIAFEETSTQDGYYAFLSGDPDNPVFYCGSYAELYSQMESGSLAFLNHQPYPNTVYRFEPTTVGVQTYELLGVSVSPNPVSDWLFIQGADHAMVEIYNETGQLVSAQTYTGPVEVSGLTSGVYFVKVTRDGRSAVKKVLKCN